MTTVDPSGGDVGLTALRTGFKPSTERSMSPPPGLHEISPRGSPETSFLVVSLLF